LLEFNFHPYQHKSLQYTHISNIATKIADDPLMTAINKSLKQSFTSVIVAHDKFHPSEVLQAVWELIQPSATIVVFS
jgi:hypothetical protein